jgi:hypothetical protein
VQAFARTPAAPFPVRRRHAAEHALADRMGVRQATATYSWVASSSNALVGAGKHNVLFPVRRRRLCTTKR